MVGGGRVTDLLCKTPDASQEGKIQQVQLSRPQGLMVKEMSPVLIRLQVSSLYRTVLAPASQARTAIQGARINKASWARPGLGSGFHAKGGAHESSHLYQKLTKALFACLSNESHWSQNHNKRNGKAEDGLNCAVCPGNLLELYFISR